MRNDIRKHQGRRFLPSGMDSLEERVVLSAGMASHVSMAAAVQANPNQGNGESGGQNQNQEQQTPLIDQVTDQINQQFAQFATQYYQLQAAYFTSLDSPPGPGGIDLATFHDQAGTLVGNLAQQVLGVIDAVPGGGGLLDNFLQLRLNSDEPGSLRHELTSLPAVGTSGLDKTGFGLTASSILQNALLSTQNLTRLYDQSLLFTTYGFFNGSLRFFNKDMFTSDLPTTTPGGPSGTDQIIDNVNRHFSTFAQDYRNALSTYYGTVGSSQFGANGDIQTFRETVAQGLTNLETDTLNAVSSVPGGAGPLGTFLNAWLKSDMPGSLQHDLLNLPPIGTSDLSPAGFGLAGNAYLSNALLGTQNAIRLYDASVNFVANGFFQQFSSRFLRNNPTTGNNGGANTGGQLSASRAGSGSGLVQAQAFLPSGPFTQGSFNNSLNGGFGTTNSGFFGFAPTAFNPNLGFGGLGNGFNFAGTGPGFPFGNSTFGTGFSFGRGGGLLSNVNSGFNPLLGVNPLMGNGFGSSFGVIGPSFTPGFSTGNPTGIGSGFGVSPGFGGFFF